MDYRTFHLLMMYGKQYGHRRIRECGFTDTEHMICAYIFAHENCSQDDIARTMRLDKTTVGKALSTLQNKHFILREQSSSDRRRNTLRVTETGKAEIADVLNIYNEWLSGILRDFSADEQEQLDAYLHKLLAAAENMATEKNSKQKKEQTNE